MCFAIAAVISEKPTSHAEKASYYGTIIGSVSSIVIVSIMSFLLLNKKYCVETLQQSSYISYEATPTPRVSYDNVVEQEETTLQHEKLRTDVLGIPHRGEEDHQEHPARRRRMSNHSYISSF